MLLLSQEKSSSSSVDTYLEPSEVLWIGFPAVLKVDETILRNAFSPFGEIVNITAFPGRGYAFVRFRSLRSACRAKDTLLGNLFGDPRVHICFAKSEYTSRGRNPVEAPSSPDIRPFSRIEASHEKLRHNKRSYENISKVPKLAPPRFITDMESQDPDLVLSRGRVMKSLLLMVHLNEDSKIWDKSCDLRGVFLSTKVVLQEIEVPTFVIILN